MKLYIDTTSNEHIVIRVNDREFTSEARQSKSQRLLPFIIESLAVEGVTLSDVTEVEVATGPGSFTGIRVGVAVAQTIAWVRDIPVNGLSVKKNEFVMINYGENRFN
jgi:tRNA threonylcarbamoyladenosine biosynthesis protein TsaB